MYHIVLIDAVTTIQLSLVVECCWDWRATGQSENFQIFCKRLLAEVEFSITLDLQAGKGTLHRKVEEIGGLNQEDRE